MNLKKNICKKQKAIFSNYLIVAKQLFHKDVPTESEEYQLQRNKNTNEMEIMFYCLEVTCVIATVAKSSKVVKPAILEAEEEGGTTAVNINFSSHLHHIIIDFSLILSMQQTNSSNHAINNKLNNSVSIFRLCSPEGSKKIFHTVYYTLIAWRYSLNEGCNWLDATNELHQRTFLPVWI